MSPEVPLLPEDEGFWYPHWREMWEESLDAPTRSRIKGAVWRGLPLADPLEARYAVTLARRERGIWRWWPVLSLILMGAALFWLLGASNTPLAAWRLWDWLFGTLHAVVFLAAAPLAYRRYRLVVHAERRNREVVASQESGS